MCLFFFNIVEKPGSKSANPDIPSTPEETTPKSTEPPLPSPKPAPAVADSSTAKTDDEEAPAPVPAPAPKPEAPKRPMIPKVGMPMMGGPALLAEMKKRQNKDKVWSYLSNWTNDF